MSYHLSQNEQSSKMLYLDSADATVYLEKQTNTNSQSFNQPLATNFLFTLKEKITVPDHIDCLVSLHSATIPYSFYNVRAGINDRIPFEITFDNGDVRTFNITIDDGNYDVYNLASSIADGTTRHITSSDWNAALTSGMYGFNTKPITITGLGGGGTVPLGDVCKMTITYDRINVGYIMSVVDVVNAAGRTVVSIKIPFLSDVPEKPTQTYANRLLGLRYLDYPTSGTWRPMATSTYDNYSTFVSNQVVDLLDNTHGLYIRQNLVSKSTLDSTEGGTFTNILERIPINVGHGGIIFYRAQDPHLSLVNIKEVDTVGIKLTDDRNNAIDLNGLNFQLGILIQFLPKGTRIQTNLSRQQIDDIQSVNIKNNTLKIKKNSKTKK